MIQLVHPLALLSLLAVPLVLALHLLRPRRRRVTLSSITLWQAVLKDRARGRGLRRLLGTLSLLLLLVSVLSLGLALGGPQWLARSDEGDDTVLVLDTSASMQTRTGSGATRFELARAAAADIVDRLPRGGRMLVMTSGRKARLRSGFESDPDTLRAVLTPLRADDEAGRPRDALALALSLLRNRPHGRVYFLTDGAFDADVDPASPQVVIRTFGAGPARNVAITRFDLRQAVARDDRFEVLLTVRNYTGAPVVVPAAIRLDERVLFQRPLQIAARGERTLVLAFPGSARGQAVARIRVDDDLAADNQAFAAVNAGEALRILLLTRGNRYLESVFDALPNVQLTKRNALPAADLAWLAQSYDVVVIDGIAVPALPTGNFLLVNTLAPGLPFSDAGRVTRPPIRGRGESALMRDVDLGAVRIAEARRIVVGQAPPGLQRLFWSQQTDLALALLDERRRLVYLGFDLAQSNFPLQSTFPLFISQSLAWLRPHGNAAIANYVAAGDAHVIALPAQVTQAILRTPAGKTETLAVKHGVLRLDATGSAGIYRYTVGEQARFFAVTLADAQESDVSNRWQGGRQGGGAPRSGVGAQALTPLWPYLLMLALVLLLLEWGVWIRSHADA